MRWAALSIAAAAFAFGSATSAAPMTREQVAADLAFFRDQAAPKDRSFTPETRERMRAFIAAAIDHARPMERYELALELAEAQALSGNAHSYSDFLSEEGLFHPLPVTFWKFEEGAIVTRAHPAFTRLLGARILSIGGVAYAEAVRRVAKFIPGTPERRLYLSPSWLERIEVLEAVGLARNGIADVAFELPSGARTVEHLGAAPTPDPAAYSPEWRRAIVPGKGPDPWPHFLDRLPSQPLYAAPPDEFAATPLDGGATLYIRSTSLSPYQGELTVMLKAYRIMDAMVKAPALPSNIVVDLRYNGGGNLFNVIAFADELAQVVGKRGRIYVLEGRATFSAAIAFAALLKKDAGGRVVLVGEEPSDNPWFWSEGGTLEAPASKLPLRYVDGYHDWAHGCTDLAKCYWPVVFHGAAVGSLQPDIAVPIRYADFIAGRDAALDAALADIAHRRKEG
jgi:hypothetical protein